jgi:hypothetical protein
VQAGDINTVNSSAKTAVDPESLVAETAVKEKQLGHE